MALRGPAIFCNDFKVICPVQSRRRKQFASRSPQISAITPTVSSLYEGRIMIVANAGWDAVDAAASGAQVVAGQAILDGRP